MDRKSWRKQRANQVQLTNEEKEATRRAKLVKTPDLIPWIEQCLYAVGRSLSDWQKDPSHDEYLQEATKGHSILGILLAELQARKST